MSGELPRADDWERAVLWMRQHYPESVFPPDSDSQDAKSGTFARKICDGIVRRAQQYANLRGES